jgi:hypothetical protein
MTEPVSTTHPAVETATGSATQLRQAGDAEYGQEKGTR